MGEIQILCCRPSFHNKEEHQVPAGETIVGVNYDHNFLEEEIHPHRDLLDEVSVENPVCVLHVSVHMLVANSKALEAAGMKDGMPDIPHMFHRLHKAYSAMLFWPVENHPAPIYNRQV